MSKNKSLANIKIMYYDISQQVRYVFAFRISAFLFLSIFLITNPHILFADTIIEAAEQYRIKGFEAQQKSNFNKALENYTKSLSLNPDNAVLYNDLGVIYENLGINARAEDSYLKAIDIDSSYLPPYLNLAYLYKDSGDMANAVKYFRARYELAEPKDRWALKAKEELVSIDPNIQKQIINDQAKKLEDQIIIETREAFALEILRAEGHYKKGQEHLEKGTLDEALKEFNRALQLTPDNPKVIRARDKVVHHQLKNRIKAQSELAIRKLNSGETESAREEFRKILTIIPNQTEKDSKK